MKAKSSLYFIIAILLVAGGTLLAVKGTDAVSKAENRKQAILETEQKNVIYDKNPGEIVKVHAAIGDFVKQGDLLFEVKAAEGGETDVLAPTEGVVSQIAVKPGDRVGPGLPVAIIQKNDYYADFYVPENQIQKLKAGQSIKIRFPYVEHSAEIGGVVASVATAPQFASLRMTRERGQADLNMYAVRISVDAAADLLPGMTAEVNLDEIAN